MSKSETALLREELAKVVAENRDWQMRMARLEAAFSKREEIFVAEIDRLRLENAELNRRLAMYENPNAPLLHKFAVQRGARRLPETDGRGGRARGGGRT